MKRILIMGLPGSGKTTLARHLIEHLELNGKRIGWLNADEVRRKYNDWDFTPEGRMRQANRMRVLADEMVDMDYVVCDFVCPTPLYRAIFSADVTIWLDTIAEGRFEDTNKIFYAPEIYDYRITEQAADKYGEYLALNILNHHVVKQAQLS